jgi:cellulase/cellobiase CelA1
LHFALWILSRSLLELSRCAGPWGSGFVATVAITDTGPNPVNGWTLAFTFPSGTESVSSSNWNDNWSESGRSVIANSLNWDGYLAPAQATPFPSASSRTRTARTPPQPGSP